MTSGYITAAARASLPIKVRYGMGKWTINYPPHDGAPSSDSVSIDGTHYVRFFDPVAAACAYLNLCETLLQSRNPAALAPSEVASLSTAGTAASGDSSPGSLGAASSPWPIA